MDITLIITGPTGSGKSALAHELADQFPISIISADSRQIIRGFDIGSAKPSPEQRTCYDYRLLDIINPGQSYSAFSFKEDSEREISKIRKAGRIPLICGGTGLYIRALTEGIFEVPSPTVELREKLEKQAEELGPEKFHDELRRIDPLEAELIHPHNVIRVTRALEIYHLTGKTKSELTHSHRLAPRDSHCLQLALTPPIDEVYQRINDRVDQMIEQGWLAEVDQLLESFGAEKIKSARAIGYRELTDHLAGTASLESSIELIKQNTRRFAKRQMTWIRSVEGIETYLNPADLLKRAHKALSSN